MTSGGPAIYWVNNQQSGRSQKPRPSVRPSILSLDSLEIETHGESETRAVGKKAGEVAQPGDVLLLSGTLGTGKTRFAQGVLWGLGGDEYARSPTFVLVNQYRARLTMYHMDLYRIETVDEIYDLGLDEYLSGDGICVVEWADKAPDLFPGWSLMVQMEHTGADSRRLKLTDRSGRFLGALGSVTSPLGHI